MPIYPNQRQNQVGNHKTVVFQDNGFTNVVYHNTAVVKFNHEQIILNSGGWDTKTTKLRMNQTSRQFDLGFNVYQENWEWFVYYNGEELLFEDRMVLNR